MKLKYLDSRHILKSKSNSLIDVPDFIFNVNYNESVVHQLITSYKANGRCGTRAQKDRSKVSFSTKKPWKQKGMGRARSGMRSSPLWRGGGRIFPSSPIENFTHKINKKMRRLGFKCIFSQLARENKIVIVNDVYIDVCKTKILIKKLKNMNINSALFITDVIDNNLYLSSRNLIFFKVIEYSRINPVILLSFKKILIKKDVILKIEELLL